MIPSEHLLNALQAMPGLLVYVLDQDDQVLVMNDAARAVLPKGVTPSDWLAGDGLHHPVTKARFGSGRGFLSALRHSGTEQPVRAAFMVPGGGETACRFQITPLPGGELTLVTALGLMAEAAPGGSGDPFPGKEQAAFLHELGNVFGILGMATEALLGMDLPARAKNKLGDMAHAVQRGNAALQAPVAPQMLHDPLQDPVDFSQIARNAGDIFRRVLPPMVTFNVSCTPGALLAGATPAELEAAVIEMLSLARKFLIARHTVAGTVALSLTCADGTATLRVTARRRDAQGETGGQAFPVADGEEDPFDTTAAQICPVARQLAKAQQGSLSTARPDTGCLHITLGLPLSLSTAQTDTQNRQTAELQGFRLCLGEKDPTLNRILSDQLRQCGATVFSCANGVEIAQLLQDTPGLDAVVTNPVLSDGLTARDLANLLQRHSPSPRLILLSSQFHPESQGLGISLSKPVRMEFLTNAIKLMPPLIPEETS